MAERISDLSQFGSKLFKCARCDKWWAKSKAELLEEIGDVSVRDAPTLLAKCKHASTFSGCGVYLASKDVHVDESPPDRLRYRWLGQLERVRATLEIQCDSCGRVRSLAPSQMNALRRKHSGDAGDIAMAELARRLRCRCGRKGVTLEWVAPASGLPPLGTKRQRDSEARGSWRLFD